MDHATQTQKSSIIETFLIFLRLGLTSFGGPVAHLGYFRDEFVVRRKWLEDKAYADIVALCQFMPGPASSQVGLAIGLSRAGYGGALAAWLGFTMPSAIILVLFAYGIDLFGDTMNAGWLTGLKIVAVVVVAQALWAMYQSLCPGRVRGSLAIVAAAVVLMVSGVLGQLAAIALGAIVGLIVLRGTDEGSGAVFRVPVSSFAAVVSLSLFFICLFGLPYLALYSDSLAIKYFDSFYRSGSLVFGGGHVVLPLLDAETVERGLVDADKFIAGYGATQAVPGPLFTFAAFLGTVMKAAPNGAVGAMICLVAIFLPSAFLVIGLLPFWNRLRRNGTVRAALNGVNATVVGLLLAALYDPVFTSSISSAKDLVVALIIFVLLILWKLPVWLVVIISALGTWGATFAGIF